MSDTSNQILESIDRASESAPRPALWVRSLVGAAIGLPFMVGLLYGGLAAREDKPIAKNTEGFLVAQADSPYSAADHTPATTPTRPPRGERTKPPRHRSSSPTRPATGTPPAPVAPTTSPTAAVTDDLLEELFGASSTSEPEPISEPPSTPAAEPETISTDPPSVPPGSLAGLDIPGWEDPPSGGDDPETSPGTTPGTTPATTPATTPETTPDSGPDGTEPGGTDPGPDKGPPDLSDLAALMQYFNEQVTAELDEKYPLFKQGDDVTLHLPNNTTVSGQLLMVANGIVTLNVRSERMRFQLASLHHADRIRCDRNFRQATILKAVEERMLKAIE